MGSLKASEMLLFNKKITTLEAEKLGLVTEVIPSSTFDAVWPRLKEMSELPPLVIFYGLEQLHTFFKINVIIMKPFQYLVAKIWEGAKSQHRPRYSSQSQSCRMRSLTYAERN